MFLKPFSPQDDLQLQRAAKESYGEGLCFHEYWLHAFKVHFKNGYTLYLIILNQ